MDAPSIHHPSLASKTSQKSLTRFPTTNPDIHSRQSGIPDNHESMSEPTTVTVKILDKEYQVSCPQDEVEALTSSARYLDQQMRQIRETGKVFGIDRIAVMAALNLANELLQNRQVLGSLQSEANGRARHLTDRIMVALAEHKQLKL